MSFSNKINDLTVIVRSAGERTENLCLHLIKQQAPTKQVFLINAKPFSKTLLMSYEKGLDIGAKWTLCIDADLLVSKNAVQTCLQEISQENKDAFGLSGLFLDKFYGDTRSRGLHLYRTSFLEKAIKFIDEVKNEMRPETEIKNKMRALGYNWISSPKIYGLHDFEQFYADIFRKMATRAQKSPDQYDYLLRYSLTRKERDNDHLVASWGLRFGNHLIPEDIKLNVDQWNKEINTLLLCNGLQEKPPINDIKKEADILLYAKRYKALSQFFFSDFKKKVKTKFFK